MLHKDVFKRGKIARTVMEHGHYPFNSSSGNCSYLMRPSQDRACVSSHSLLPVPSLAACCLWRYSRTQEKVVWDGDSNDEFS